MSSAALKNPDPSPIPHRPKSRRAKSPAVAWRRVADVLPKDGQQVIAIYQGVYQHRLVTFWRDDVGSPHFGVPGEPDGKGSQPATHWHPLLRLPERRP